MQRLTLRWAVGMEILLTLDCTHNQRARRAGNLSDVKEETKLSRWTCPLLGGLRTVKAEQVINIWALGAEPLNASTVATTYSGGAGG